MSQVRLALITKKPLNLSPSDIAHRNHDIQNIMNCRPLIAIIFPKYDNDTVLLLNKTG